MPSYFRSPAPCVFLGIIFALLGSRVSCAPPDNFSGLKGVTLKESTALPDLARELLSTKKAKIEGVQVIEDRAESLVVRVAYKDLETTEAMFLIVNAEDGKRRTIKEVDTSKTALTATEGEITVRLEIGANVARGTQFDQSFLVVLIGKEGDFKKAAIKVFQCNKKWEKSLAPEEMIIKVVAEPIGKSKSLTAGSGPSLVLNPKVFVTANPVLKPVGDGRSSGPKITVDKLQPVVQTISKDVTPRLPSNIGGIESTTSVIKITPSLVGLKAANLVMGLPKDVKDNNGQGPSTNAIRLFDTLSSDIGLTAEDIMDLHPNIYEDANPDSGYFYYLPRGYYLYWDEDTGYALRMLYGVSTGESNANVVSIAARITSGVDPMDIALVRKLLQKYCESTSRKFRDLKPFPFSSMSVSLKGDLGQYNIPPERISVTGISDIAGMIDISMTTDPVTKENLQMVLTQGLGISGTVTYQSASSSGSGSLEVTIPVLIKFADKHSFGARQFARGVKFKNASFFPAKIKYLNVLVPGESPTVYSYELADTIVPSRASATIEAHKVPSWLDTSALKMWVDYSLVADDQDAIAKAIEAVTGGVTSIAQSEITFRTLTPLADTGVALVLVSVSSKYFDPNASGEIVKTLELTQDGASFKVGPVYLVNRQPGEEKPGDPLFKYKLTVVNPDGTTKEGTTWTESNNLTIYVGSAQLRSIIGVPTTPESPAPAEQPATPG
ncbi:MAG: hypothetical protein QHH26_00550 [Armatimonadota bacterium]|nr:hypothetical protein [Armatimonadota bacterium]